MTGDNSRQKYNLRGSDLGFIKRSKRFGPFREVHVGDPFKRTEGANIKHCDDLAEV